ncbi:MAG: hypothetical protein ACKVTZ_05365 [Bacteroidia bacterium]
MIAQITIFFSNNPNFFKNFSLFFSKVQIFSELFFAEIQKMLDEVSPKFKDAKTKLGQITVPSDEEEITKLVQGMNKGIEEVSKMLEEQQTWLRTYFSKGKSARRAMFYEKRVSLWGIPVK